MTNLSKSKALTQFLITHLHQACGDWPRVADTPLCLEYEMPSGVE